MYIYEKYLSLQKHYRSLASSRDKNLVSVDIRFGFCVIRLMKSWLFSSIGFKTLLDNSFSLFRLVNISKPSFFK